MARGELSVRLRSLLGAAAQVTRAPDGVPHVAVQSAEACALLLRTASAEGWRARIEGGGGWMARDAPADLAVSTRRLTQLVEVNATDLVATAQTGIEIGALRRGLADHGAWLAHDAPGRDRTLGSLLATGSAGPLRGGFGMLKDHVLGLTLVTGDGRVVQTGGRVVKNVAGYDLAKLAAGSFGAFGVITSVHVRLRAVPRADLTLTTPGERDELLDAAHAVRDAAAAPAAVELLSPRAGGGRSWTLALRLIGTEAEVAADRVTVQPAAGRALSEHVGPEAAAFWAAALSGCASAPVTLRLGAVPDGLDDALDLVAHHLDEPVRDWISVTVPAGTIRWSGQATAEQVARLRHAAAEHEWPVTLERAPWDVRARAAHFGAYREGSARLVRGLKAVFDPADVLVVPLGADA